MECHYLSNTINYKGEDTNFKSVYFQEEKYGDVIASVEFKNGISQDFLFNLKDTIIDPILRLLKEIYIEFNNSLNTQKKDF